MSISTDQMKYLRKFQMYCSEFIAQMLELSPQNKELEKYNRKFHILCSSNPFEPIKLYYNHVYPLKKEIDAQNIDYFLNISKSTFEGDSLLDVLNLCELWESLNDDEKEQNKPIIFQYLQILNKICTKVFTT